MNINGWHEFLEIIRTFAPLVAASVAIFAAAFVYITGRNKERRERRLAAIEQAFDMVSDAASKYARILGARGTEEAPGILNEYWDGVFTKVQRLQSEIPDFMRVTTRLRLLGLIGCADAVLEFQGGCFKAYEACIDFGSSTDALEAANRNVESRVVATLNGLEAAHRAIEAQGLREAFADWFGGASPPP